MEQPVHLLRYDVGRSKPMQRKLKFNITVKIRRIPLTQITMFSIDPLLYAGWWSSMYDWWCLSLWPCLSWFFPLIVGVLWVLDLRWHQLPSRVLLYLPPPCFPLFFDPINWRMLEDECLEGNTIINNRNLQACAHIYSWKKLKKRMSYLFSYPLLFYFLPQFDDYYHNNQEKMNMISRILPTPSIIYSRSL
jgi:hypothetical protein